jgi:hypothetical protein
MRLALVDLSCGPPALDSQLMEPWPRFATPLTSPVAFLGTSRPVFHFEPPAFRPHARSMSTGPTHSARAAACFFGLGRNCASSRDAFHRAVQPWARERQGQTCRHTRGEFHFKPARPFSLGYAPRLRQQIRWGLWPSQTACSRNPCRPIPLQPKTCAADICCPQSFKERAPTPVCATSAVA